MKSAFLCAVLLVLPFVALGQFDVPVTRFLEVNSGTKSEQLEQYQTQLEQLKMLQERESATQSALQEQMAALNAQAAAAAAAPAPQAAAPVAVPEAFSFKENLEAESSTAVAAGAGAAEGSQKEKKLATAMTAVKEDIMAKLREAQRESAWVKDVEKIVKQYKKKVKNVKTNLKKIRNDIKNLIKKKRQIRNAQIQVQLDARLGDASNDLKMIKSKLESIRAQQKAFEKNRKKIALTISKINSEMQHLKGIKPKKEEAPKAKKGEKKKDGKKDGKKGKKSKASKACKKQCKDNKDKKACLKKCAADEKAKAQKKAFLEEEDSDAESEESDE
jgi:DNA repair exonuclease SbcCD ATPase subunit